MRALDMAQALQTVCDAAPDAPLVHVRHTPARAGRCRPLPDWLDPDLERACHRAGIETLWEHQRHGADLAHSGRHLVLATGTASGKSLAYLLPLLHDLGAGARHANGRDATALYLAPTKALTGDQFARVGRLAPAQVRSATYDGDTPAEERRWIRRNAAYVLSNPDMLHHSILPGHEHWSGFLRALRYVVVDECHVYRGVFGAHLACVLRRLRRIATRYGADPTFVFASATVSDPAAQASSLLGRPVTAVTDDASPHGPVTYAFLQPLVPQTETAGPVASVRAADPGHLPDPAPAPDTGTDREGAADQGPTPPSTLTVCADVMADLVAGGVQTVAFASSRLGVEVLATRAKRRLRSASGGAQPPSGTPAPDASSVAAYRGGYLPEERRALEADLRSGRLLGLAATSALELGIDISDLDAVVLAGWPGTRSSFWQRAGRAGRSGRPALVTLVASADPLDHYLVQHPDDVFDASIEAGVLDPANPYVLAPHLSAAAAELPLTEADVDVFGPTMPGLADVLVQRGLLRRRPRGWFWTRPERPSDLVSLRGIGDTVRIVESGTGRVLGTIDSARADAAVHTGAVYLHQQQPYVVTELDHDEGAALVVAGDPGWSTQARSTSSFDVLTVQEACALGPVSMYLGTVAVSTQVTSFVRRRPTGRVIGEHRLDLPRRTLRTQAVWWTMTPESLTDAGVVDVPGAAHAAEHAAIGLLPLLATADRWDIGGVSTALHPDTGLPTVMVYDGLPGGAGIAARGYQRWRAWLQRTRDAVLGCRCISGCPGCVQSPKCGNGNEPLDKAGAIRLLDLVLAQASPDAGQAHEQNVRVGP